MDAKCSAAFTARWISCIASNVFITRIDLWHKFAIKTDFCIGLLGEEGQNVGEISAAVAEYGGILGGDKKLSVEYPYL
jgi:hypothetical protein